MSNPLHLDDLVGSINGYVNLSNNHMAPGPLGTYMLKIEVRKMLQEVLLRGQSAREDLLSISGL